MSIKQVVDLPGCVPVKVWTMDVEMGAMQQLVNLSKMPFIHSHVAAMPDVHFGMGATIGSVIPTLGAIIPAAVGVDIGCGMTAVKTELSGDQLTDLPKLRADIERAVPHGGPGKHGSWLEQGRYGIPAAIDRFWYYKLKPAYDEICAKYPAINKGLTVEQLGTLGGGNHFVEICLDEMDTVWVVIHSGSRGVGNRIGVHFIREAKREMERYHILNTLPDKDLSYFVKDTEVFDDYCDAVFWAQEFAVASRMFMREAVLGVLRKTVPKGFKTQKDAIDCCHNYISVENHFGKNVIVTRKGATFAGEGSLAIIPGSMGAKSFIVMGKGNAQSFNSCSHGAGRSMGRKEAERRFTVEDLVEQTKGIECPKGKEHIDEIPAAYKNIDEVMANQTDLVSVLHTLRQIINVKG